MSATTGTVLRDVYTANRTISTPRWQTEGLVKLGAAMRTALSP